MLRMFIIVPVLLLGCPMVTLAQDKQGDVLFYSFNDDLVKGDLARPDGEILSIRKNRKGPSLVEARGHFFPEMVKSVEDL